MPIGISKRTIIGGLVAAAAAISAGITWFILYGPGAWTDNISNRNLSDTTADAGLPSFKSPKHQIHS